MAGQQESRDGSTNTTEAAWDGANAEQMSIPDLSRVIEQISNICRRALILIPDLPVQTEEALDKVTSRGDTDEVYIAILGASGSGKSTLYNSILGSRGVLPQGSSGQACTAAPIEIRGARDQSVLYDIEVLYIDAQEFRTDIVAAQRAMMFPSEAKEHAMSQVSKLGAVFPDLSKDELGTLPPDDLLNRIKLFSTSESHKSNDFDKAQSFLRKRIVATKQSRLPTLARWPLVKVARVYVQSKFFKHKIVLTDVPGHGDSNAFRSARSKEYITRAAATCVVTPASRGGTDGSLSSMIRESLQDIHFGGRYDKVILVSTKSDAVSTEELEQDRDDDVRDECRVKKAKLDKKIESLQASSSRTKERLRNAQAWEKAHKNDHSRWKNVDRALTGGRAVRYPRTRKGNTSSFEKLDPDQQPLRHKDVRAKVQEFKALHDKYVTKSERLQVLLAEEVNQLASLSAKRADFVAKMKENLIIDRNTTLKDMQLDMYVEEIRNIDIEVREAAESNPDPESRPHIPDRDYDEIRKILPIFCTTARSYQNIKGFTKDTPQHKICNNVNDTGIPEFKNYLLTIGKALQQAALRDMYRDALEALNDLSLVVKTGLKPQVIDPERVMQVNVAVRSSLDGFDAAMSTVFQSLNTEIKDKYQTEVASNISNVRQNAKTNAKNEMSRWTKSPADGGFYSVEYKAAVRRNGEWKGSRITLNFNERFRQSVQKGAQAYTDKVFTSNTGGVKSMVDVCVTQCLQFCQNFHDESRPQMMATGVSYQALRKLDDLLKIRTAKLVKAAADHKKRLSETHSSTTAQLADDIRESLANGYDEAWEATADQLGAKISRVQAMDKALYRHVKDNKILARPLRRWEKRMNAYLEAENQKMQQYVSKFIDTWTASYTQALLNRSEKIDQSDNPGRDEIRNMIIDTRLIDDKTLGLTQEIEEDEDADQADHPVETAEIKEEQEDDLKLVDSDVELAERDDSETDEQTEDGMDSE